MKNLVYLAFAFAIISGCATTETPLQNAKFVPEERIYLKLQGTSKENARAIFVRDTGLVGAAVFQHLYINGKKAASLNPGERVEFSFAPGEYVMGVVPTDAFGVHALNSIDQELKAGRTYYYRIFTDGNSFRTAVQRFVPVVP